MIFWLHGFSLWKPLLTSGILNQWTIAILGQPLRFFLVQERVQSFSTKPKRSVCTYCSGDHLVNICKKFLDLSHEKRFLDVKRNNLCTNYPTSGHRFKECKSTFGCSVCKLKLHTLLHWEVSRSSSGALDAPGFSGAIESGGEVQNCLLICRGIYCWELR